MVPIQKGKKLVVDLYVVGRRYSNGPAVTSGKLKLKLGWIFDKWDYSC